MSIEFQQRAASRACSGTRSWATRRMPALQKRSPVLLGAEGYLDWCCAGPGRDEAAEASGRARFADLVLVKLGLMFQADLAEVTRHIAASA